jgi:hypothetical protein
MRKIHRMVWLLAMAFGYSAILSSQTKPHAPLSKRIFHNDPSKYQQLAGVHGGAGSMGIIPLLTHEDFYTNFLFLHRGRLAPRSGIGHHFHNTCEEMLFILDGEAARLVGVRRSFSAAQGHVSRKQRTAVAEGGLAREPLH